MLVYRQRKNIQQTSNFDYIARMQYICSVYLHIDTCCNSNFNWLPPLSFVCICHVVCTVKLLTLHLSLNNFVNKIVLHILLNLNYNVHIKSYIKIQSSLCTYGIKYKSPCNILSKFITHFFVCFYNYGIS